MPNEQDYQMFSQRQGGKPTEPLSPSDLTQLEEAEGNTVDLPWLFAVVRRRILVMTVAAIALGGLAGGFIIWNSKKTPTSYRGSFSVLVEPVTAEGRLAKLSLLAQTGNNAAVQDISGLGIANSDLVDYETQMRVLKSPKLMTPLIKQLQARYPEITYTSVLEQLEIVRISVEKDGKQQGTKLLNVTYQDKNPEKIQFVLEQLAKSYLDYSLQERKTSLNKGIQFIDEQLPDLQKRVDSLQGELQKLRQQYTLNEPDATGKALTEQAQFLRSQRIDIQAQLAEAKTSDKNRQRQLSADNTTSVLSSAANGGRAYDGLIGELQKLDTEIALKSSVFREDNPQLVNLRDKQKKLRTLVDQEAQKSLANSAGKIQELEARDRSLAEAESQIDDKIRVFPAVLRRYSDLNRDLQIATESLKQFLQKRETLKLDASQRDIPWEVIAPPALQRDKLGKLIPASAKKTKRQLAVAAVLSMLLGIGVGFLVEILHTVFHTPDEIKAATRLRLLGVIPFAKELKKLDKKSKKLAPARLGQLGAQVFIPLHRQAQDDQAASFLEAFRSFYTNIRLISSRKPIHSLVIGSAVSGDGNTPGTDRGCHWSASFTSRF
jgi:uncharacterized protein involved in exopolysaccharide biosynthesis